MSTALRKAYYEMVLTHCILEILRLQIEINLKNERIFPVNYTKKNFNRI